MMSNEEFAEGILDALSALIGLSEETTGRLRAIADAVSSPAESKIVRDFLEEDWRGFRSEMDNLLRLETDISRVLTYEYAPVDGEPDEMLLPDARSLSPWQLVDVRFAPFDFVQPDPDNIRIIMDYGTKRATGPGAFSVWAHPVETSPIRQCMLLFFRDDQGAEELFIFDRGSLLRMPPADEQLARFFKERSPESGHLKDQADFVSFLTELGGQEALQAALSDASVEPLTESQLQGVMTWLGRSPKVRDALLRNIYDRVSPVLAEGQRSLREVSRDVADFMDTVRHEAHQSLAAIEKGHEKRLKGLHADVGKMRMITEGVRKRADRTDADNQALRRRVRELEAQQASAGERAALSASADDVVRKALDAYF
ncbi:hypothetical protein [Burkholderia cenocepacia]|uniref:hypothetical protein n=1 Tax=Burkholderia cenocepacia TaxID=95486 RepID=UPI000760D706|nr:hypothetical protein [Burkholderia cenocepacia]KWU26398.1 hypothetical protein AS149_25760 [Burkholderia cenocepacia]